MNYFNPPKTELPPEHCIFRPKEIGRPRLLSRLPKFYLEAAYASSEWIEVDALDDYKVRINKYSLADVQHAARVVWDWPMTIKEIEKQFGRQGAKAEITRVKQIIKAIEKTGEVWPYVSMFANDIIELLTIERISDHKDDFGSHHGDGWHRLVAAHEMQRTTVEFMFFLPRH